MTDDVQDQTERARQEADTSIANVFSLLVLMAVVAWWAWT